METHYAQVQRSQVCNSVLGSHCFEHCIQEYGVFSVKEQ